MTSPVDTVRRFYDALGRGDGTKSLNGRKLSASHTTELGTVRRPSSRIFSCPYCPISEPRRRNRLSLSPEPLLGVWHKAQCELLCDQALH